MLAILERNAVDTNTPNQAHYARVKDRSKAVVVALCGQKITPTTRDVALLPLCEECIEVKALRDSFKL